MSSVDSTGPVKGPAPAQRAEVAEQEGVADWLNAMMFLLYEVMAKGLTDDLAKIHDLNDLASAANAIDKIMTKRADNIGDETLTDLLNGWYYLLDLRAAGQAPRDADLFLDNPDFQELIATIEEMAAIAKEDPNYKENPKWLELKEKIYGSPEMMDVRDPSGMMDLRKPGEMMDLTSPPEEPTRDPGEMMDLRTPGLLDRIANLGEHYNMTAERFASTATGALNTFYVLVKKKLAQAKMMADYFVKFIKAEQENASHIISQMGR